MIGSGRAPDGMLLESESVRIQRVRRGLIPMRHIPSKSALTGRRSRPEYAVRSGAPETTMRLMGVQEAGGGGDSDSLLSEPSAGEHCLRQAR